MDELGNKIYRLLDEHTKRYKPEQGATPQRVHFLLGGIQELQLIARDIKNLYGDFFYKERLEGIRLKLHNRREVLAEDYHYYWEFAGPESIEREYARGHVTAVSDFVKALTEGCIEGIYEPYSVRQLVVYKEKSWI